MRVCLLDIESAPHMAYVWGFFKQNISPSQVLKNRSIMSYAYKWLGEDTIYYEESRKLNDKRLVKHIIGVLDEADVVIAHNAKRFDLAVINARAIKHGLKPPSPYKVIDTLLEARKHFKFDKNTLEYLATYLGCTPKQSHKKFPGFELWLQCLAQNDDAWEELKAYNVQDVLTLEEVYLKMRPWMTTHPNVGVYAEGDTPVCPKCGGKHIQWRGLYRNNTAVYKKFQCQTCGGWGRTRFSEYDKEKGKVLATNAS